MKSRCGVHFTRHLRANGIEKVICTERWVTRYRSSPQDGATVGSDRAREESAMHQTKSNCHVDDVNNATTIHLYKANCCREFFDSQHYVDQAKCLVER